MKKTILLLGILLLSIASAQDLVDLVAPFTWYNETGTTTYPLNTNSASTQGQLSAAVAYATVATGQMIPEFTINPANMAMMRFGSFQVSGQFNSYGSSTKNTLNTLSFIKPVKVYQGNYVWGLSVDRERNFIQKYSDNDISQTAEGGITNWKYATAIEALEDIYIGAEIGLLTGSRENDIEYLSNSLISSIGNGGYVENVSYVGLSTKLGLTYRPYKFLTVGASLDLPTPVSVSHDIREYNNNNSNFDYSVTKPVTYHAGFALTMKYFDIYYSTDLTNWNELSFSDASMLQSVEDGINREIEDILTNTVSQHIGAALHVPMLPLHLYGGYQYLPNADAYSTSNLFSLANLNPTEAADKFRSSFSWGASFFMKNGLSITASFETQHIYENDELTKPKNNTLALTYFF